MSTSTVLRNLTDGLDCQVRHPVAGWELTGSGPGGLHARYDDVPEVMSSQHAVTHDALAT